MSASGRLYFTAIKYANANWLFDSRSCVPASCQVFAHRWHIKSSSWFQLIKLPLSAEFSLTSGAYMKRIGLLKQTSETFTFQFVFA